MTRHGDADPDAQRFFLRPGFWTGMAYLYTLADGFAVCFAADEMWPFGEIALTLWALCFGALTFAVVRRTRGHDAGSPAAQRAQRFVSLWKALAAAMLLALGLAMLAKSLALPPARERPRALLFYCTLSALLPATVFGIVLGGEEAYRQGQRAAERAAENARCAPSCVCYANGAEAPVAVAGVLVLSYVGFFLTQSLMFEPVTALLLFVVTAFSAGLLSREHRGDFIVSLMPLWFAMFVAVVMQTLLTIAAFSMEYQGVLALAAERDAAVLAYGCIATLLPAEVLCAFLVVFGMYHAGHSARWNSVAYRQVEEALITHQFMRGELRGDLRRSPPGPVGASGALIECVARQRDAPHAHEADTDADSFNDVEHVPLNDLKAQPRLQEMVSTLTVYRNDADMPPMQDLDISTVHNGVYTVLVRDHNAF